MTLATHIVAGAAASRLFSTHPVQAFFVGWISHYILDSIIHWDYPLKAYSSDKHAPLESKLDLNLNKYLFMDMGKVILDVLIGFMILLLADHKIHSGNIWFLVAGGLGGVVPDFIQFLFGVSKSRFLAKLQKFHHFMHAGKTLEDRPIIGITTQACLVILAVLLLSLPL